MNYVFYDMKYLNENLVSIAKKRDLKYFKHHFPQKEPNLLEKKSRQFWPKHFHLAFNDLNLIFPRTFKNKKKILMR